jgi:hypothetical protein
MPRRAGDSDHMVVFRVPDTLMVRSDGSRRWDSDSSRKSCVLSVASEVVRTDALLCRGFRRLELLIALDDDAVRSDAPRRWGFRHA